MKKYYILVVCIILLFIVSYGLFVQDLPYRHGKIIYINLDRRPDRKEHMVQEFKKHGIENYQRFQAIDGKDQRTEQEMSLFKPNRLKPGVIGCFLSHYYIWKSLIDSDYDYFIVLEDDIQFSEDIYNVMTNIRFYMGTDPNYIIHLFNDSKNKKDSIEIVKSSWRNQGTRAYVINKIVAKKLVKIIESNKQRDAIDWVMINNIPKMGIYHPSIFSQNEALGSDIDHKL